MPCRIIPLLILLAALGPALPAPAQTAEAQTTETQTTGAELGPFLFSDIRAGTARQDLAALPGMYDCSAELGAEALCLDGVEHLGRDWAADFAFHRGRLTAVSLVRPFDRSLYLDAFAAITKRSALVAMQSEEGTLDLIRMLAEDADGQHFTDTVTGFEARGLRASRLAYVFLDKLSIAPVSDKAGDLSTLTAWAGPGLVRTVLVLHAGEPGRNTGPTGATEWLALVFEAPIFQKDFSEMAE